MLKHIQLLRFCLCCLLSIAVQTILIHSACAQSGGGDNSVRDQIATLSDSLGGILGIVFVIFVIRALFFKKKK